MTPYEIMLSESQERMLIIVQAGREDEVKRIFDKWDLPWAQIGRSPTPAKWLSSITGGGGGHSGQKAGGRSAGLSPAKRANRPI
jgi:hypothetical protein